MMSHTVASGTIVTGVLENIGVVVGIFFLASYMRAKIEGV
jgi:hypothetical protein